MGSCTHVEIGFAISCITTIIRSLLILSSFIYNAYHTFLTINDLERIRPIEENEDTYDSFSCLSDKNSSMFFAWQAFIRLAKFKAWLDGPSIIHVKYFVEFSVVPGIYWCVDSLQEFSAICWFLYDSQFLKILALIYFRNKCCWKDNCIMDILLYRVIN